MLKDKTVSEFLKALSSASPAPGGGSASALGGAMAVGLFEMAVRITYKNVPELIDPFLAKLVPLREQGVSLIDEDTEAFRIVMEAYGLPKDGEEERKARSVKIQAALRRATEVPLRTAENSLALMQGGQELIALCRESCMSDAAVGFFLAEAAFKGALANVELNLSSLKDEAYVGEVRERVRVMRKWHEEQAGVVHLLIAHRLGY
ncbi:MAG: cyclodeaminase/cyclohydrolase family protein [Candidatus Eremiobacteraeota bacterium]|nr:cyclodeaminase/cyclohydrolase family protein [Candidatus Eremiobacteraeota bacterium]